MQIMRSSNTHKLTNMHDAGNNCPASNSFGQAKGVAKYNHANTQTHKNATPIPRARLNNASVTRRAAITRTLLNQRMNATAAFPGWETTRKRVCTHPPCWVKPHPY